MTPSKQEKYKCPITKEGGYTTDCCESTGLGTGCSEIDKCPVYKYNKQKEKQEVKE